MIVMYLLWTAVRRTGLGPDSDRSLASAEASGGRAWWRGDLVDAESVDLRRDEYVEEDVDRAEDQKRDARIKSRKGWLWRIYYWVA